MLSIICPDGGNHLVMSGANNINIVSFERDNVHYRLLHASMQASERLAYSSYLSEAIHSALHSRILIQLSMRIQLFGQLKIATILHQLVRAKSHLFWGSVGLRHAHHPQCLSQQEAKVALLSSSSSSWA